MSALSGKSILILATNGFEQSELEVTQAKLKEAGATVHVASPESGEIKGWDKKDWGRAVNVAMALDAPQPIAAAMLEGLSFGKFSPISSAAPALKDLNAHDVRLRTAG